MRVLGAVTGLIALATLLPLGFLAVRAFSDLTLTWEIIWRFRTLEIIGETLLLVVAVTALAAILGVALAWVTVRVKLPFGRAVSAALVLPLLFPSFVMAMVMIEIYGTGGVLEGWFNALFGVNQRFAIHGFGGALFVLVMLTYPYFYVTARATMLRLDYQLENVAQSAGHGVWGTFRRSVLPFLKSGLLFSGVLVALYTLSDFGVVALLRQTTFTTVIYQQLESSVNLSLTAGLSVLLTVLAATIAFAAGVFGDGRVQYRVSPAAARPPTLFGGRFAVWGGTIFCLFVILVALAAPFTVLIGWLVGNIDGASFMALTGSMLGTLAAFAAGTALTVVAAYPIAAYVATSNGFVARMLTALFQIGYGVPSIVIALAIVLVGIHLVPVLYQSLIGMAIAYAIVFLPVAIGFLVTAIRQTDPRFVEAARSLGSSRRRIFFNIRLPLLAQGFFGAIVMVGVLIMKELPIALLLSPIGFKTLATSIWSSAEESFFSQAALAAIFLVLISLPFVYLFVRRGRQHIV